MKWAQLQAGANSVLTPINHVDIKNTVSITSIVFAAGVKTLTFYFRIMGTHHRAFGAIITFLRINEIEIESEEEYNRAMSNPKYMEVRDSEDHNHVIEKPNLLYNDVQCRCSCESFRFTYAYADKKNRAMTGADFATYIRKTPLPPLGRPRRNPDRIPGIDKHLEVAMNYLSRKGFVI